MNATGDQRTPTAAQAGWLALALSSVGVLSAGCGFVLHGTIAFLAAGLAVGVCLACGLGSLLITARLQQPEFGLYQVLVNMVLRAGVPLGICFFVYWRGGILVETGFVFYVMPLYFATIAVDTLLLVGRSKTVTCESAEAS